MLRTGSGSGNHQRFIQQPRQHTPKESKPSGGHGRKKQEGLVDLGQRPQSKSISTNQKNYHQMRKRGRNAPGGLSQKQRWELGYSQAKQWEMHWLAPHQPAFPQYLRLSVQDAVLVPKSLLRESLLGGRTTQRLAVDPRRPPSGSCCPPSPAAAGGTLSMGPLHRAGIMHLAWGFPFERALQMFN